jgi:hypothetical protein
MILSKLIAPFGKMGGQGYLQDISMIANLAGKAVLGNDIHQAGVVNSALIIWSAHRRTIIKLI